MDKDKVFSILRSLKEINLKNSMHKVEEESGVYFNLDYFRDLFMAGQWVQLESYLSSFTTVHESPNVFSRILLHKHRDAVKSFDEELYTKLCKDQPENSDERMESLLARYGDTIEGRTETLDKLIEYIALDPNLSGKLDFPPVPPPVVAHVNVAAGPPPVGAQVDVVAGPLVAQVGVAGGVPLVAPVDVDHVVAGPLVAQVGVAGGVPLVAPEDVAPEDVVVGPLVAQVGVAGGVPLVAPVDVDDVVAGPLVAQVGVAGGVPLVAPEDVAPEDVVVGPLVAQVGVAAGVPLVAPVVVDDVVAVPPPLPRRRSRRVLRGVVIASVPSLPAAARRRRTPTIRVDPADVDAADDDAGAL